MSSRVLTDHQEKLVGQAYVGGKSSHELGLRHGRSHGVILAALHRQGIKRRSRTEINRRFSNVQEKLMGKQYLNGKPSTDLAFEYKTNPTTILRILSRRGIKIRPMFESNRKYRFDQGIFGRLTERDMYWAGFWMADGCVCQYKNAYGNPIVSMSLALAKRDERHLKKFKEFMKSDRDTYPRICSDGDRMRLVFTSQKVFNSLNKIGVVPCKTGREKFKGEAVNNRHAWRGVVDGDGSVGEYKSANSIRPQLKLYGSRFILNQFREFVKKNEIKTKARAVKDGGKNCWQLGFANRKAYGVIKLLYAKCSIALDRKWEKAQTILKKYRTKYEPIGDTT